MFHSCSKTFRQGRAVLCALAIFAALVPAAFAQPKPPGAPADAEGWHAVTVAEGIPHPWGIVWLPDGKPLITSRNGTLHTVKGKKFVEVPMEGLPEVLVLDQGGLLDIALHPEKSDKPRVYMTLSTGTRNANRTTLVRGVYDGERVKDIETLFKVEPDSTEGQHFGSRLLWLPDGTLLMSVGDSGNPPLRVGGMLARDQAQNLKSHLGSIVRLTDDGKPAPDNPLKDKKGAQPEIWTYGHRNIQGLARDPDSGRIWASEHGPKGGDEVNLIEGGKNYGWPLQSFGRDYKTDEPIGRPSVKGMVDPRVVWTPSIAASGLAFYTGDRFPKWRGSLFSGGLVSKDVRRIQLDDKANAVRQERLLIGSRVRDVRQGPDGFLYVLTDEENGKLLRIEPK